MNLREFLIEKYGGIEQAARGIDVSKVSVYTYIKNPGVMQLKTVRHICEQTKTDLITFLRIVKYYEE